MRDEIYLMLLLTEMQIKTIQNYYFQSLKLRNTDIADRYHCMLKFLYRVRNDYWNLNRRGLNIVRLKMENWTYMISSILLTKIYEYLMEGGNNEKFCYVTGIIDEDTYKIIPINILTPEMAIQNPVHVEGELQSIRDNLAFLDEYGHTVLLQCHKHPGTGPECTKPSLLDINTHQDWEKFYPVIGIIFVDGGHFRFFSAEKKFNVQIYGKGVKKLDNSVYYFEKQEGNQS